MYLRQLPRMANRTYRRSEQAIHSEVIRGPMKNPYEVMRSKEQEMLRLRKEMEALRIAARLLEAEDPAKPTDGQTTLSRVVEMP